MAVYGGIATRREGKITSKREHDEVHQVRSLADRISSLPDDVLNHIVSCLPIRETVATSILSQRWRYIWTSCSNVFILTYLKIHQHHHHRHHQHPELINFSIFSFPCSRSFKLPPWFSGFPNLKILYISHLSLDITTFNTLLSACHSLEQFTLFRCKTSRLSISSPNTSLTTLQLLQLSNLRSFYMYASVPSLKLLEIHECPNLSCIGFDSPNLRCLKYVGKTYKRLNFMFFNTLSCLVESDVRINWKGVEKQPDVAELTSLGTLAWNLTSVTHLVVSNWLSQLCLSKTLHIFENLNEFHWHGKLDNQFDLITLATFLRDCPSLQKLRIEISKSTVNWYYKNIKEKENFLQHLDYKFHHLKTIEIIGILPSSMEMDFVNFLLDKAVVLEFMFLTCTMNGSQLLGQMSSHLSPIWQKQELSHLPLDLQLQTVSPRASSSAKIVLW